MGQRRQTTVFCKWQVWRDESQDGGDQQNAGDVVLEVQKLVVDGTSDVTDVVLETKVLVSRRLEDKK